MMYLKGSCSVNPVIAVLNNVRTFVGDNLDSCLRGTDLYD